MLAKDTIAASWPDRSPCSCHDADHIFPDASLGLGLTKKLIPLQKKE
ncbi:hypothetical protein [Limnospira fusiformis]|uniref:Uncharacterized protein n=1 Tax=Limnospira fusiformis PMC 851.14 TaxID=2219512 RepID=A0ABU9EU32_LIMFS|nr:hypothetical protein HFV01_09195 [Limnospira fusiformis SAG 85.79]QNH56002.1 MAG: hypothetical protein H2674_16565 [Limnospira indica BM01]